MGIKNNYNIKLVNKKNNKSLNIDIEQSEIKEKPKLSLALHNFSPKEELHEYPLLEEIAQKMKDNTRYFLKKMDKLFSVDPSDVEEEGLYDVDFTGSDRRLEYTINYNTVDEYADTFAFTQGGPLGLILELQIDNKNRTFTYRSSWKKDYTKINEYQGLNNKSLSGEAYMIKEFNKFLDVILNKPKDLKYDEG